MSSWTKNGKPISGVKIWANVAFGTAGGGVERTASRSDGSFELFNYPVNPRVIQNELTRGLVGFSHPDYVGQGIGDIYALARMIAKLCGLSWRGVTIVTGTVIDVTGRPVPNAMVKVAREDGNFSNKLTMTDANGKFALRGLGEGLTMLYARALDIKQTVHMRIADNGDQNDLQVRLKPIPLPADLKKHAVLGMQLADVTPELKSAYDLYFDDGAVILDPGNDSDRLKIGRACRRLPLLGGRPDSASAAFASSSTRFSPRPSVKTPQRTRFTGFVSFTNSSRSMDCRRREHDAISETHERRP